MSETPTRTVEAIAVALLEASETLHAAILASESGTESGDAEIELVDATYDRRASVFAELQASCTTQSVLSVAARTCIDRVRELDRVILAFGASQSDALRRERIALQRRRSVIQVHATREREEPRLITLKA